MATRDVESFFEERDGGEKDTGALDALTPKTAPDAHVRVEYGHGAWALPGDRAEIEERLREMSRVLEGASRGFDRRLMGPEEGGAVNDLSARRDSARLNALHGSGIVRSRPESAYDDLIELVARMADARFAALTFIDEDSMWSKAATHPVVREMPTYHDAPCVHVLESGEPLVVLDALADPRFRSCPIVTGGPAMRFFAGVPVVSWGGHVLGVLFAADPAPRGAFPAAAVVALTKFAALASELIESRRGDRDGAEERGRTGSGADAGDASTGGLAVSFGEDDSVSLGSAQRFEALTNLIPQIVWSTTPEGYHDYFNERWYAYTEMPRTGDQGWNWKNYLHPDDVERTLEAWHRALATGEPYEVLYRFRRASDGEYRWFIGRAMPLFNAAGEIARWFGTCTDVHEERMAEAKLTRVAEFRRAVMSLVEESLTARRPEDFYQHVLDRAVGVIPGAQAGSVLFRAPDGMFDFVASVGYDLESLKQVRFTPEQVSCGGMRSDRPALITDFEEATPRSPHERHVMETAGRVFDIEVSLSIPVMLDREATAFVTLDNFDSPDVFGEEATEMARIFAGYVATLAQRFRLERQLHRLAYEDLLTALPNRAALDVRIDEMFERADESGGAAAILFMDLDGFKAVNDTLGHRAGDEVLYVVGQRLMRCVRAGEAVGRLGGDEFAVVLEGRDVVPQAHVVAKRVLDALSEPIATRDGVVRVSASVGIAVYPANGSTAEEVLQSADLAMYQAKELGKNSYSLFRAGATFDPAG